MVFGKTEEEYFCDRGWTGQIRLKWLEKMAALERLSAQPIASLNARAALQRALSDALD